MDTKHSNIEYHEFEDNDNELEQPSLYLSVTEDNEYRDNYMNNSIHNSINNSNTFRSINLEEPTTFKNTQDIWKPTFDNTWNSPNHNTLNDYDNNANDKPWDYKTENAPYTIKNKYYDTEKMSDSIEDSRHILRKHIGNLNERKSKLNNIENLSEMLTENGNKFKKHSRALKIQQISKYTFHILCIGVLVILIITLIVILAKS
jgi:hypothetical protein